MRTDAFQRAMTPALQVRRAWLVLTLSFALFAAILAATFAASYWIYRHATAPEIATLEIVSGGGALVRSPGDSDWRLVDSETRLRERDQISTALGTVVWVTMFDGSTVEVAEDTIVAVERMRSSRFLNRTKLIVLELERGAVYAGTAGRGDYTYSEFVVRAGELTVVMAEERGQDNAGSFLVEVIEAVVDGGSSQSMRAAVLRGRANLDGPSGMLTLSTDQQVIVSEVGAYGAVTSAVRELIVNGTFEQGLTGWVEFITRSPLSPEGIPTGASIELVQDYSQRGNTVAIEFLRPSDALNAASTGVRQRIGKTVRLQSSLQLALDIKVSDQQPPSTGVDLLQFPLIVEMNYVDSAGQEARWSHGYYIFSEPDVAIPRDRATRIERDTWQRIVFDLRNLSPLPRQITSIVVYASGNSYQTRVANISLTSAELVEPE